jgi:hypothetical protein
MAMQRASGVAWWCAITILLSAFLLFQVQPIISKMILPWFGGGPAVWTTCMLFFQVLLLGGYAYAHFIEQLPNMRLRVGIHVLFLVGAAVSLPITPDGAWKPLDGTQPTWRILTLLAVNVGLPYFVLASTGPLVQAWFGRALPTRSPYRLYALSNVGSLGALLTYPFLFETTMTTSTQGSIWSVGFGLFAVLCGGLAITMGRTLVHHDPNLTTAPVHEVAERLAGESSDSPKIVPFPGLPHRSEDLGQVPIDSFSETAALAETVQAIPPTLERRLAWLLLPALASVLLLAITNHVCQDVAVVPFLWVVPLSLYLLSFIICFDGELWYRRRLFAIGTILSLTLISVVQLKQVIEDKIGSTKLESWLKLLGLKADFFDLTDELIFEASIYLVMLFLVCMVCHGELVRLKPPTRWLTSFYLMVSAGGALGGILVALACPQIFSTHLELQIAIVIAFLLALGVLWDDVWQVWPVTQVWGKAITVMVGFALLLLVVRAQFESLNTGARVSIRNFYGVLSIEEGYEDDDYNHLRRLLNGRILHGSQFQAAERRREPTTYYNEESGIGTALTQFSDQPLRVAVVGLGTGTIATYGRPGDYYCFYEINPNVQMLAQREFTFLSDTAATTEIVLGDARISFERQEPQNYDIIALDAFSGDAIPAHLLTVEAFELYFRHLQPEGVIAVHISNKHLELTPVIGGIAEHFEIPGIKIEWNQDTYVGEAGSDWVLLTRNRDFLDDPIVVERSQDLRDLYTPIPLWTDQYSNLFQILQ